ncbi:hypothetical protein JG687_00013679, partial [Phytophthora cactorum]
PHRLVAVTKELQKSTLTLSAVRRLFDQVIKQYTVLKPRLFATATIVNNTNLERGETLNAAEKSTCAGFRSPDLEWSSSRGTEECSIVRAAFKKRKVVKRSHFVGVAYVLATSNKCEHFFSLAKLVIANLRMRMAPDRLEMVMCLHNNRDLWDLSAVDEVRSRLGRNNANN